MINYYIVGHQSPDTDSVVSAIVLASYLKKKGVTAQPLIIGKPNRETKFILDKFKQEVPKSLKRTPAGAKFYLVDHGGLDQSISGLKEENIVGIIDHHQLGGIKTDAPIFCRVEAVGSTSTLIAKMFNEAGWKIDKKTASLLIAGIISDTLNLTSKTTTREDRVILNELIKTAKIDHKKLAQEIFEAKSDISGMNLKKIITNDFKEYEHKGKRLGVGVFEAVDVSSFNEKKEEIFKVLTKLKEEKRFDLLFFGSVDIIKRKTYLFIPDREEADISKKAFGLSSSDTKSVVTLDGITSRKKEIIPSIFKSI